MAKPPTKRWSRIGLLLCTISAIGLFGCCGWVALFGESPHNGIRVEQLDAELRSDLPIGSTRAEAEAWFASRGITPGRVIGESLREVGLAAFIRNDSLLDSAEIQVYIYFDDADRVREIKVSRFVFSF